MPLIVAFNLRKDDRLSEIETAVREALASIPEYKIDLAAVELVPVLKVEGHHGTVTRMNIDLWERPELTKDGLQELATRVGKAFQAVAGKDRKIKVVIQPYDIRTAGWVAL